MITQERLQELFTCDPNEGIFYYKTSRGPKKAGSMAGTFENGYIRMVVDRGRYSAHRLVWLFFFGEFPEGELDHIDGNGTNNALNNLREATSQENKRNRTINKNNSSGYKGVSLCKKNNKYEAYIWVDKKQIHLGYYDTPEEASKVYQAKARELFGEFYRDTTKE